MEVRTKSGTPKVVGMYKKEEKEKALKLYEEVKSVRKVIQKLGYPTREGLHKWLRDSKNPPDKTKTPRRRINNSPEHSLHPPPELKLETIRRCFERGEKVYLSPIVDCFDGFIPSWTIGTEKC